MRRTVKAARLCLHAGCCRNGFPTRQPGVSFKPADRSRENPRPFSRKPSTLFVKTLDPFRENPRPFLGKPSRVSGRTVVIPAGRPRLSSPKGFRLVLGPGLCRMPFFHASCRPQASSRQSSSDRLMRMAQKFGPHMVQYFPPVSLDVFQYSRALSGSRARLNWSFHLNS